MPATQSYVCKADAPHDARDPPAVDALASIAELGGDPGNTAGAVRFTMHDSYPGGEPGNSRPPASPGSSCPGPAAVAGAGDAEDAAQPLHAVAALLVGDDLDAVQKPSVNDCRFRHNFVVRHGRWDGMAVADEALSILDAKFAILPPHLDERQRLLYPRPRSWATAGSRSWRPAEVSESTISLGQDECADGAVPLGRVRGHGGGRKPAAERNPGSGPVIRGLVRAQRCCCVQGGGLPSPTLMSEWQEPASSLRVRRTCGPACSDPARPALLTHALSLSRAHGGGLSSTGTLHRLPHSTLAIEVAGMYARRSCRSVQEQAGEAPLAYRPCPPAGTRVLSVFTQWDEVADMGVTARRSPAEGLLQPRRTYDRGHRTHVCQEHMAGPHKPFHGR